MRTWVALSVTVFFLSGCAPAAVSGSAAGLEGVASMIESVGSTATGFKQSKSTLELNGANKGLVEAQTAMMQTQVDQTRNDHERADHERVVTGKLLREMSGEYHEPIFETLASWVEAGGDPDFAFKYALTRVDEERASKEVPQQTLSLKQQPSLAPVLPAMHSTSHAQVLTTGKRAPASQSDSSESHQTNSPEGG
ncbi:MAG TPA: hypothetical protein VJN94_03400 [Candidatus Binataceae bacterium]|nr:hypothetical protein [Candidatus Binataceae bacterium]